ncbi:transcriptional regulator, putative [Photobacterium profundum 3TCK]|uniref:Transcriptional regulator, putative n=1 Tax=Photobacterium profundum 3TCK TaxID=314280 RepID=Q1YVN3_9GAMM|nr:transcriptional regulator, putative [Photobacterium profundum 3TCK]
MRRVNILPDVRTLKLLADELGVPLSYFFCEDETSAEIACLVAQMTEREKKELILSLIQTKT